MKLTNTLILLNKTVFWVAQNVTLEFRTVMQLRILNYGHQKGIESYESKKSRYVFTFLIATKSY